MSKPEVAVKSLRGFGAFRAIITSGSVVLERPLRLFYVIEPDQPRSIAVGFAVTRGLRRAVDRNYIKRLMRESFRLQQVIVTNSQTVTGALKLVILYAGGKSKNPKTVSLNEISTSMHALLNSIADGLAV
jgi:ribonuclease P protein component